MEAVYSDNSLFRRAPSSRRHSRPSPPRPRQPRLFKPSATQRAGMRRIVRRIMRGSWDVWAAAKDKDKHSLFGDERQRWHFLWSARQQLLSSLLTRVRTLMKVQKGGWKVGNHHLRINDTDRQHPETSRLPSWENTVLKMRPLCRGRRPARAWIIDEGQAWFKMKRLRVGCEPLPQCVL